MITEDMQNMTNGLLFNALPVPLLTPGFIFCFFNCFPLAFIGFLLPDPLKNRNKKVSTTGEKKVRLGGVLEGQDHPKKNLVLAKEREVR